MKTLSLEQMENVQGGWGSREWCLAGAMLTVGVGFLSGPGMLGALTIMSAAATAMGC